jgi:hypothetical protein
MRPASVSKMVAQSQSDFVYDYALLKTQMEYFGLLSPSQTDLLFFLPRSLLEEEHGDSFCS